MESLTNKISELLAHGLTQQDIAQRLGCSQATVSRHRNLLRNRYIANSKGELQPQTERGSQLQKNPGSEVRDSDILRRTHQSGDSTISFRTISPVKEMVRYVADLHGYSLSEFSRISVLEKLVRMRSNDEE